MDSPCAFMNIIIRFMIVANHDLTHDMRIVAIYIHGCIASFLIVVTN